MHIGTIYRRTRKESNGKKILRAEIRFDGIAGCLRTPAGGSSRQIVMIVENGKIRSRLLSSRESARLMGLPDTYRLPQNTTDALFLVGDGIVVPAVDHIVSSLVDPIVNSQLRLTRVEASGERQAG
ncbi:MAG: hypothetical protein EOP48_18910 [Sphingobacteriales bacterium]|nr:MAG: hypothetical protein EOP48_18910 [Sphingobacteriales bacterium]